MFPQKLFYTLNVKSFQIEISIYRRHFSSIIVEFLEVIKIWIFSIVVSYSVNFTFDLPVILVLTVPVYENVTL